MRWTLHP